MTPERWRQIGELFDAAVRIDPAEREAWLRAACGGDDDLRAEVGRLLAQDERADRDGLLTPPERDGPASGSDGELAPPRRSPPSRERRADRRRAETRRPTTPAASLPGRRSRRRPRATADLRAPDRSCGRGSASCR